MSILVVDDEPQFAAFLGKGLTAAGFRVDTALTGAEGYQLALHDRVELILLDVGLPDVDGFSLLAEIRRERKEVPIIMLTARGEVEDRVRGLNLGANDYYLPKPFSFEELVARIRSQLRFQSTQSSLILTAADVTLDLRQRTVRRGEEEVRLTPKEFAVLEFFLRHPGQMLSKPQLLNGVWEYDFDPGSNIVEVYVGYLRHKLDRPGEDSLIETVRGGGYRLRHE